MNNRSIKFLPLYIQHLLVITIIHIIIQYNFRTIVPKYIYFINIWTYLSLIFLWMADAILGYRIMMYQYSLGFAGRVSFTILFVVLVCSILFKGV